MQQEAEITINGIKLSHDKALVIRVALETLANVLASDLGFRDDGIALTDQYQTDVAYLRALIDRRAPHIR